MKLKFELVNGYGVLVDKEADINIGDWFFLDMTDNNLPNELHQMGPNKKSKTGGINFYHNTAWTNCCSKIIFAEPELNIEGVPVFEWRDFEIRKLAVENYKKQKIGFATTESIEPMKKYINGFIDGYKSNPARFTEDQIILTVENLFNWFIENRSSKRIVKDVLVEKLQKTIKYPKYVVMESEVIDDKGVVIDLIY